MMKISAKSQLTDVLKMSKNVQGVFKKYNLVCPGCKGASEETIEKVAINNGLNLKELLADLNNALE